MHGIQALQFMGYDKNTLGDVGEQIGLTREIVRQIQLKELNCL